MATPNGSATNQPRPPTAEQKAAVVRVRRCQVTAFYEILDIDAAASEADIKKAYRKLSLLTHPDKNSVAGADEAFKMVSRAFQILSDADKRRKFDTFGGDPDSRFGAGAGGGGGGGGGMGGMGGMGGGMGSPFSRGSGMGPGGAGMWQEELSPEELFAQFFGAGFGAGGFGGGPGFVFNYGGGPGFRVHQFGGPTFRRRPTATNGQARQAPQGLLGSLLQWLPFLVLFVLPLLSSLFSGLGDSGPGMKFDDPMAPYTMKRTTPRLKVNYFLNPRDVSDYSGQQLASLDRKAEKKFIVVLKDDCEEEIDLRERMYREAQGWFFPDIEKMQKAQNMEMKSCRRLDQLGIARTVY